LAGAHLRDHRVHVLHPSELTAAETENWQALRQRTGEYGSCLFSPDFAVLAGQSRSDARIGFIYRDDSLVCIFPYHKRASGFARPLGAPFSDYSGPMVVPGKAPDLPGILRLLGLAAYRSGTLLDPGNHFAIPEHARTETNLIRLGNLDPETYIEAQRAAYPKRFKNFRRLERRMEEQFPQLEFRFGPPEPEAYKALLELKSAQFQQSGLIDLTRAKYARDMLDTVARAPQGFMLGLWHKDRLLSGHFGIRIGAKFHPWIAAYQPDLSAFSPGNVLLKRIIAAMPEMELTEYDLSGGDDHYKKYYANASRTIGHIYGASTSLLGRTRQAQNGLWRAAGAHLTGSRANRLRNRVDHGAVCHPRLSERMSDIAYALQNRSVNPAIAE